LKKASSQKELVEWLKVPELHIHTKIQIVYPPVISRSKRVYRTAWENA
jgi:hypothetical protein